MCSYNNYESKTGKNAFCLQNISFYFLCGEIGRCVFVGRLLKIPRVSRVNLSMQVRAKTAAAVGRWSELVSLGECVVLLK